MIIDPNGRKAVIKNIQRNLENGEFHAKAEINDPVLSQKESHDITHVFTQSRGKIAYKAKTALCVFITGIATKLINKNTEIVGIEKIPKNLRGAIITSNHFSPFENTVIRLLTMKLKIKHPAIISQTTNFATKGAIGFLMKYCDTVPISAEPRYLARDFLSVLKEKLTVKEQPILLYPEQEMWFNYRKPRPPKNGAYFYAAKLNVPILSCFVEIIDLNEDENPEFKKVKYKLHILGVLYPKEELSAKENTEYLANKDYELKKICYEKVYKKPLTYTFESEDIAGWKGSL